MIEAELFPLVLKRESGPHEPVAQYIGPTDGTAWPDNLNVGVRVRDQAVTILPVRSQSKCEQRQRVRRSKAARD